MTTSTKELIDKLLGLESIFPAQGSKTCGEAAQRLRELDSQSQKTDALYDSAYIAGAQAGFSCALSDDAETLNKLIASRNGYLKPINCSGAVKSGGTPNE